ncbi:hypothetical protein [Macrococcoides caseolyticum]|uniref:hypothetical protein n=1 Tax=Macrococcoides caseolyticum TaxID=69966 RepID=UPI001F2F501A|nr:hypothetical protein [Macrococcus caseolyticus]MCE4957026.1 hypothetical protein [Macrococcus caseolyticus]
MDIKSYAHVFVKLIPRKKRTIKQLFESDCTPLIVVLQSGIVLYTDENNKIFYHENTTKVKYKAYLNEHVTPPLIQLLNDDKIDNGIIIDATTGLANDLTLMTKFFPQSTFYAFESNFFIHMAIKWGFIFYYNELVQNEIDTSTIHFIYGSVEQHQAILQSSEVIYIDPMYEETIDTSNIASLVNFISYTPDRDAQLLDTIFKKFSGKIILRCHYKSQLIEKYQFNMQVRKYSKTHYGYRYINNNR